MEEDFFAPVEAEPGSAGAEITANLAKNFFGIDVGNLPATKPDGTPALTDLAQTKIPKGIAKQTTGEKTDSAVNPIEDGKGTIDESTPGTSSASPKNNLKNVIPNPLEQFASYAPLWTLAVLTPQQYNKPSSYRTEDLSFAGDFDADFESGTITAESSMIFSSGGRGDKYRTQTLNGAPEYFIDNFRMKTVVAPSVKTGNSNAIKFEFDIIEPYSMGLLLQSLQNAALKAGHTNYLSAPYVLRLDIKGWGETGLEITSIKPKYFVLKFNKVSFKVDEGGSNYEVHAVPYNHDGFSDAINTLFKDISLTLGDEGTVEELLVSGPKSLCKFLNDNEELLVKQGKIGIPDVYEIQFPETSDEFISVEAPAADQGATKSVSGTQTKNVVSGTSLGSDSAQGTGNYGKNPIGQSTFGYDQTGSGIIPFKLEGDVVDDSGKVIRDKMVIDSNKRTFLFTQSQSLTQILNQIVVSSSYAKDTVSKPKIGPDGMVSWFRIDSQIEYLDFDPVIGDYAKKIIYRIVPYKVHHTIFSNPTSAPIGYGEKAKEVVKHYQYIYSGQNVDVLNFNIEINNLFYVGVNPSGEARTQSVVNPDQNGVAPNPGSETPTGEGAAPEAQAANLGRARSRRNPALLENNLKGGSGDRSTEQMVAEAFHRAFLEGTSGDLIKVKLEILGDPYWLVDSGMGNYFSPASSGSEMITEDGTMNFENGDVYIYITFRTPSDVDTTTGLYEFSKEQSESPFSGLYRVTMCENIFSGGTFKQELTCVRLPGPQDQQLPTDPENALATKVGKQKGIASSPISSPYEFTDEEADALWDEIDAQFAALDAETAAASAPPTQVEEQLAETEWDDNLGEYIETGRVWDDNLGDFV